MHVQRYKRHDRPYQYIAARVGSPFDPLPYWFRWLEENGTLRYDSEYNVEVKVITGAWQTVSPGDWVVVQRASPLGPVGFENATIWLVEHEDFIKLWVPI